MVEYVEWSLSNKIKVKLNSKGVEMYEDYFKEIGKVKAKIDKNGWTEMMGFTFMQIYGRCIEEMWGDLPFKEYVKVEKM